MPDAHQTRLAALRETFGDYDALLVSAPSNIFYLSGFTGSAGLLAVTRGEAFLYSDFRYRLQAAEQAPDYEFVEVERGLVKGVGEKLAARGLSKVGYDPAHLTCQQLATLIRGRAGASVDARGRRGGGPARGEDRDGDRADAARGGAGRSRAQPHRVADAAGREGARPGAGGRIRHAAGGRGSGRLQSYRRLRPAQRAAPRGSHRPRAGAGRPGGGGHRRPRCRLLLRHDPHLRRSRKLPKSRATSTPSSIRRSAARFPRPGRARCARKWTALPAL